MILTAALLFMLTADVPTVLHIRVSGGGDAKPCALMIDGQTIDAMNAAALDSVIRAHPPSEWQVRLSADLDTAYRCIGGVLYKLQSAGYRFDPAEVIVASDNP